jgi:hypothetical protein
MCQVAPSDASRNRCPNCNGNKYTRPVCPSDFLSRCATRSRVGSIVALVHIQKHAIARAFCNRLARVAIRKIQSAPLRKNSQLFWANYSHVRNRRNIISSANHRAICPHHHRRTRSRGEHHRTGFQVRSDSFLSRSHAAKRQIRFLFELECHRSIAYRKLSLSIGGKVVAFVQRRSRGCRATPT